MATDRFINYDSDTLIVVSDMTTAFEAKRLFPSASVVWPGISVMGLKVKHLVRTTRLLSESVTQQECHLAWFNEQVMARLHPTEGVVTELYID